MGFSQTDDQHHARQVYSPTPQGSQSSSAVVRSNGPHDALGRPMLRRSLPRSQQPLHCSRRRVSSGSPPRRFLLTPSPQRPAGLAGPTDRHRQAPTSWRRSDLLGALSLGKASFCFYLTPLTPRQSDLSRPPPPPLVPHRARHELAFSVALHRYDTGLRDQHQRCLLKVLSQTVDAAFLKSATRLTNKAAFCDALMGISSESLGLVLGGRLKLEQRRRLICVGNAHNEAINLGGIVPL